MILPTKEQFIEALAQIDRLVPAPRTLGRALQLLRNPDSGLYAIADLIRCDSALAVDVLRCANSAYYSRMTHVADVGDAVQVIGFRETIRLVSLVATHQTTNRNLGSYGIAAEDFWAESLINGLFLEGLARQVDIANEGEAYTSGLLRFVGRLAIDQVLQYLGGGLFWDGTTPLPDWERENVGLTQAEVGARLLRKWEFPESIALAVELQDSSALRGPGAHLPLVQAAHFVSRLLPAGRGLAAINSTGAIAALDLSDHPFVKTYGVTAELIAMVRADAQRAFAGIRETLYR